MSTTDSSPVVLHLDPEHGPLRAAVIAVLLISLWLFFQLVRTLLPGLVPESLLGYTFALSCLSAIPLALAVTWLVETALKRTWHSGERVVLDDQGLRYVTRESPLAAVGTAEYVIDWDKRLNQLNWFFRLEGYPRRGREKRVPNKWLCLACELQQEDTRLNVFTYVRPATAEAVINEYDGEPFHELSLAKLYKEAEHKRRDAGMRPEIPNKFLHAPEARYWLAERRRWEQGGELSPDDFTTLLTYVKRHAQRETEQETHGT